MSTIIHVVHHLKSVNGSKTQERFLKGLFSEISRKNILDNDSVCFSCLVSVSKVIACADIINCIPKARITYIIGIL